MAMNKKEQARMDELAVLLASARALRWVDPVEPDLPIPIGHSHTTGWTFNTYTRRVHQAWSSSVAHGDGPGPAKHTTGSQGGKVLFSTKARALQGLRYFLTVSYAAHLASVDAEIVDAQSSVLKTVGDIAP